MAPPITSSPSPGSLEALIFASFDVIYCAWWESAMRTTVTLDDDLVAKAKSYTGLKETSAVIRAALESFIQGEAARRLALLGGRMPDIQDIPRRRAEPA
jgi:Arc/MetJ family transcription regulator